MEKATNYSQYNDYNYVTYFIYILYYIVYIYRMFPKVTHVFVMIFRYNVCLRKTAVLGFWYGVLAETRGRTF